MIKKCGLTIKNMSNKKFRKTEEVIFAAFSECSEIPSVGLMAKRTRVSRVTIYRHHHTTHKIMANYERYILEIYSNQMKKMMARKNSSLKVILYQTLGFMVSHKKILAVLIKRENHIIIKKIFLKLKPKILKVMRLPKNSHKMFEIYLNEVCALVMIWGKKGFLEPEIENLVKEILYLTQTARERLLPLSD